MKNYYLKEAIKNALVNEEFTGKLEKGDVVKLKKGLETNEVALVIKPFSNGDFEYQIANIKTGKLLIPMRFWDDFDYSFNTKNKRAKSNDISEHLDKYSRDFKALLKKANGDVTRVIYNNNLVANYNW